MSHAVHDARREPTAWANWRATVYHGLPHDLYRFHPEPGGHLAFLGRICPEKRVDRAIAIAKRAGVELKIAAKVDAADKEYFETEIRHLLDEPLVDFIGEIGDGEKEAFLGGAAALLMPIGWPEPFGLVVIEAMACGTPVNPDRKPCAGRGREAAASRLARPNLRRRVTTAMRTTRSSLLFARLGRTP